MREQPVSRLLHRSTTDRVFPARRAVGKPSASEARMSDMVHGSASLAAGPEPTDGPTEPSFGSMPLKFDLGRLLNVADSVKASLFVAANLTCGGRDRSRISTAISKGPQVYGAGAPVLCS